MMESDIIVSKSKTTSTCCSVGENGFDDSEHTSQNGRLMSGIYSNGISSSTDNGIVELQSDINSTLFSESQGRLHSTATSVSDAKNNSANGSRKRGLTEKVEIKDGQNCVAVISESDSEDESKQKTDKSASGKGLESEIHDTTGEQSKNVDSCSLAKKMDSIDNISSAITDNKLVGLGKLGALKTVDDGSNDVSSDSNQPVDYSMAKHTVQSEPAFSKPKPLSTQTHTAPDSASPRDLTVRKAAQKVEQKGDLFRPLGRLLHDLGLELVREQVYCDLIEIQTAKDAKNKLEEREKSQLVKLVEAREKLAARNAPYKIPDKRCVRCSFSASSNNVMTMHKQYGTLSRVDSNIHVCCACGSADNFRTRSAAQFITHMTTVHGLPAHLLKKPAPFTCSSCSFEHKNYSRLEAHVAKCTKKFVLSTNLQPLPGDCDIPLVYRPSERLRAGSSMMLQPSSNVMPARPLLNTVKPQPGLPLGYTRPPITTIHSSIICEICGKLVEGREALWSHFRTTHHVELSRATMSNNEPWMKCDVCTGRFWTYQGLSRHLLLAHNRTIAAGYSGPGLQAVAPISRCHLCGGSQTSNPLSHFSAYHNITLLEMYHAKMCCMCNRKLNSGRSFEEHMVEQHSDIFANYDVLRTVLQALTTARFFKADDCREPAVRPVQLASGHNYDGNGGRQPSTSSSSALNSVSAHSSQQTSLLKGQLPTEMSAPKLHPPGPRGPHQQRSQQSTSRTSSAAQGSSQAAAWATPDQSSTTQGSQQSTAQANPDQSPTAQGSQQSTVRTTPPSRRRSTQKSPRSARSADPGASPASVNVKKKREHSSTATAASTATSTPVKTPEKGATAEEVKKLYEDLADIGRPILRSMRRRLGSTTTTTTTTASKLDTVKDVNCESSATQNISNRVESLSPVESELHSVPTKKLCVANAGSESLVNAEIMSDNFD